MPKPAKAGKKKLGKVGLGARVHDLPVAKLGERAINEKLFKIVKWPANVAFAAHEANHIIGAPVCYSIT